MSRTGMPPAAQDPVAKQAIGWLVLLRSGEAQALDREAYLAWRRANPAHEAACAHLERTLGVFQKTEGHGASGRVIQRTLEARPTRRDVLQRSLLGLGLMVGAGLLGNRVVPLQGLLADLHTATGERRRFRLSDGSDLILNARSSADVHFDSNVRRVHLYSGSAVIQVANDSRRDFSVTTLGSQIDSSGQRFMVQSDNEQGLAVAIQGPLKVSNAAGNLSLLNHQSVSFSAFSLGKPQALQGGEDAWTDGFLEARNRPLIEVVEALRPYRAGVLQVDPRVAALKVSGLFPLDDSDLALAALVQTLPVALKIRTALWVEVVPKQTA